MSLVEAPAVSKRYCSAEINDSTNLECCPVYSRHCFKSSLAGELQNLLEKKNKKRKMENRMRTTTGESFRHSGDCIKH